MADCYHPTFTGAPQDGSAWIEGGDCTKRNVRGGGWSLLDWTLHVARRLRDAEGEPIGILVISIDLDNLTQTEWDKIIAVNLTGPMNMIKAVAPGMKARGYGKIVNFCSLVLNGRWDGYVPYVASKGAVLGLTKSLARELGAFGVEGEHPFLGLSQRRFWKWNGVTGRFQR